MNIGAAMAAALAVRNLRRVIDCVFFIEFSKDRTPPSYSLSRYTGRGLG
jgi:hypothetical protein